MMHSVNKLCRLKALSKVTPILHSHNRKASNLLLELLQPPLASSLRTMVVPVVSNNNRPTITTINSSMVVRLEMVLPLNIEPSADMVPNLKDLLSLKPQLNRLHLAMLLLAVKARTVVTTLLIRLHKANNKLVKVVNPNSLAILNSLKLVIRMDTHTIRAHTMLRT